MKPAELTVPEEFGPYIVYERLGVGGMATVHRAKKRGIAGFERGVALKRMLPHLAEDSEFVNSFIREAKLASLLVHPNIAQIYDFGRVGSVYYIAMEHVDGFDVRKMLRYSNRHKEPLPLNVVLSVLCELCDALEYAHSFVDENGQPQGIVHRDVSPSNLIVAMSGHLKVIDFGIAKANVRQLHTESGRVKGKLGYMSPEAVSGRSFGPVSDVFSAGVVAHELLTAHPLFSAKTDYDTLIRIHEAEIPPPSRRNPAVPVALDDLVLAALARDPEHRLQTAGAFRQGLEYVADQSGIRFSARDVAEWRARIATTDDPWGSRTSLPNVSSSSVSRAFPFPESRNSLGQSHRSAAAESLPLTAPPTSPGPRARTSSQLDAVGEEELVADLTWGPQAAPSPSLPMVSEPPSIPALPPVAVAAIGEARPRGVGSPTALPAGSPAGSIGASLQTSRRGLFARLALVVLFTIAAGLAVYQFVLRPKKVVPPPAPAASIKFVVQPADAVVEIGGQEVGRQAPFEAQLGPGVYTIRARKDGYRPWTKEVTLHDGDRPTVQVELEAAMAHLSLTSQPPGLAVQIDGKQIEQVTPIEIPITVGPHAIVVTNAAGFSWSQSFTADIDGKYSYVAPLTQTKRTAAPAAAATIHAPPPPPEREHADRSEHAERVADRTDRTDRSERNDRIDRGDRSKRATPGAPSRVTAKEPEPETEPPPAPRTAPPSPVTKIAEPLPPPKTAEPAAPVIPEPAKPPAAPAPPPSKAPPVVAPTAVTKLAGEIPALKASGVTEAFADIIAKLCIDERGRVTSVKLIKAIPEIIEELQRILSGWRYKPYVNASGAVSPACFPLTFRVVFKHSR